MKTQIANPSSRTGLLTAALSVIGATVQSADTPVTLKNAFKDSFLIGVALNQRQFTEQDTNGAVLTKLHFNAISPENVMKWESIHPRPGPDRYDFAAADRYVEFGEKNGMFIVGHKLVTFWGVTDQDSWRRFGNPLLFDREGKPKPCFDAVIQTAAAARAPSLQSRRRNRSEPKA